MERWRSRMSAGSGKCVRANHELPENPPLSRTEERLEKLERELAAAKRRNRWAFTAVILLLVAVGCRYKNVSGRHATGTQDEVKARRFVVVDEQGQVCAELGVAINGEPRLIMTDAQGKTRALLGMGADGTSSLQMYNAEGTSRALLGVATNDMSILVMSDAHGKRRASLTVDSDGMPMLAMSDAQTKLRATLIVDSAGEPVLEMRGAQGKTGALLGVHAGGSPVLESPTNKGKPEPGWVWLLMEAEGHFC